MNNSVPNSSDGPIFEKRRAKDGRFLTKIRALDGRKGKIQVLVFKKARKFDSRLFSRLHWLGRASKFKLMRRNHLFKVHSLVATWFNLLNSSLTLWTCTKSQKDGQNCKNTGVRRAILPKCPSRRANQSFYGRLWHTAIACGLNVILNYMRNDGGENGQNSMKCSLSFVLFCSHEKSVNGQNSMKTSQSRAILRGSTCNISAHSNTSISPNIHTLPSLKQSIPGGFKSKRKVSCRNLIQNKDV